MSEINGCCNNPICQGYGKSFEQPPATPAPACDGYAYGGYDRGWSDGDKGAHEIMDAMKEKDNE